MGSQCYGVSLERCKLGEGGFGMVDSITLEVRMVGVK